MGTPLVEPFKQLKLFDSRERKDDETLPILYLLVMVNSGPREETAVEDSFEEKRCYIQTLRETSKLVGAVVAQHPEHDVGDLFHVAFALRLEPEERLRQGLRRRVFSRIHRSRAV